MRLDRHYPHRVVIRGRGPEVEAIARDLRGQGGILLMTEVDTYYGFRTTELRDEALTIVREIHGPTCAMPAESARAERPV